MPSPKRNWQKPTILGFGCANLFFGAVGVYFQVGVVLSFLRHDRPTADEPYLPQAFYIMTAMDFVSLVILAVAGFYLLRLNQKGVLLCNMVFIYEIGSFVLSSGLTLAFLMAGGEWTLVGNSMAGAGGIGSMGTSPQFLTGYPLIGLIVLNIARQGLNAHVKTERAGSHGQ